MEAWPPRPVPNRRGQLVESWHNVARLVAALALLKGGMVLLVKKPMVWIRTKRKEACLPRTCAKSKRVICWLSTKSGHVSVSPCLGS